ncbi:MAG: glucose 1-dehydrogenase [Spirochaetes bacterium]|nr:glucose 1-dehydrogenase [Spirochaetota bacterium]
MNFKDKIVIVTGAGQGIGRCIALAYAAEGAKVIIAELDSLSAAETLMLIKKSDWYAEAILTDVGDPDDITELFHTINEKYGRVDILINNTGISVTKSLYDLSIEEWDRILNVNLRGIFLCSREAAKLMRKRKKGSIVNIASTRAFMSEPDTEAYSASKGGIVALTHSLAASLSEDGIQVNCISPGWIDTGKFGELREIDHKQHLSGRVGTVDDIARACLYLTDESNNFINGTNLIIDGGMTKKMIYEE